MVGQGYLYLYEVLRGLRATGQEGFEGFIAELLAIHTGHSFRLCNSGRQFGHDAGVSPATDNRIVVECKRYGQPTELDEHDLLGALDQSSRRHPDLDLWILAASKHVPKQIADELSASAEEKGLWLLILDSEGTEPSPIAVFCALRPEATVRAIGHRTHRSDENRLRGTLEAIRAHPGFARKGDELSKQLDGSRLGFDSTREHCRRWLVDRFGNRSRSRAAFGQDIGVEDEDAHPVCRSSVSAALDDWFSGALRDCPIAVLRAEEGYGKTWASALWLWNRLSHAEFSSLPLVFTSKGLTSLNDPHALVAEGLARVHQPDRYELFRRRLPRWLTRPPAREPLFLFVFDGLNERPCLDWRGLLESLSATPWEGRVAVLATTRPSTWERVRGVPAKIIEVPEYDDPELTQALTHHSLSLAEIPEGLQSLIRKPRYCDLAARHHKDLIRDGDYSPERLLYEDMRDRWERKSYGNPLDHDQFNEVLAGLATRFRASVRPLAETQIREAVPNDPGEILDDLKDSGVLLREAGPLPRYRVDPLRLRYGLGLLLYDELRHGTHTTRGELADALETWLEPQPDMNAKAGILGAAVLFAAEAKGCPRDIFCALLRRWICVRNWDDRWKEDVGIHLARLPAEYITVTEEIYRDGLNDLAAKERLQYALCSRRHRPEVARPMVEACERWMGFIQNEGKYYGRASQAPRSAEELARIEGLLGTLDAGSVRYQGISLTLVESESLMDLKPLALMFIGAGQRGPFLNALIRWAVSHAIIGFTLHKEMVEWIFRLAPDRVDRDLVEQLRPLVASGDEVLQKAADLLLKCCGSNETNRLREELPAGLYPRTTCAGEQERDPCTSGYAWRRGDCEPCMGRSDIAAEAIAARLEQHALDPTLKAPPGFGERLSEALGTLNDYRIRDTRSQTEEDYNLKRIEPAMAAFSPGAFAEFHRGILRTAPELTDGEASRFRWFLENHALVMGESEHRAVEALWERLLADIRHGQAERDANSWKESLHLESDLFGALLPGWSPVERLERFLSRPPEAVVSYHFEEYFAGLDHQHAGRLLELTNSDRWQNVVMALDFLTDMVPPADPKLRSRVLQLLSHENYEVRIRALFLAHRKGDEALIGAILAGPYRTNANSPFAESQWAAEFFAIHGGNKPFHALAERINPVFANILVAHRGDVPEEVEAYAEILGDLPGGGRDREVTNWRTLAAVAVRRPELASGWAATVLSNDRADVQRVFFSPGAYIQLSWALLEAQPALGADVWRRLRERDLSFRFTEPGMKIDSSIAALFRIRNHIVLSLRQELLNGFANDLDLFHVAVVAHSTGEQNWLGEQIRGLVTSPDLWRRAMGLTLLGFAQFGEVEFESLLDMADASETWLEAVVRNAKVNQRRNLWARHWFEQFATEKDDDRAWAAFRLFLRCVDLRWWTWKDDFPIKGGPNGLRDHFLARNAGDIEHAAEKNVGNLKKTLFTLEASDDAFRFLDSLRALKEM